MAGNLAERLQLVVDATTSGAEAKFARLSGAAKETGETSQRTAAQVADAADRVAQAQARARDAADAVRVAMLRLDEVRGKENATASQLAAAEARVEAARRKEHLATRDLTAATEAQVTANQHAARSSEDAAQASGEAGKAAGKMGVDLKGLAATAGGLVGGISLADWAHDAITGFLDGARASQAMATSMNATVEQAGAFLGLVGSVGLELDDLIEIQAEFATKIKDGLTQAGTEVKKNADGTVNWSSTIVDALAELQKMPDATERNRVGFAMFGEEGYKQLSRLLNSGVDVNDALEQIGTPFTDEDVALSREFDDTMRDLKMTSGELGRTLGRAVVPFIVGLVDAGRDVAGVLGSIPGPIAATAGAAALLGFAMRSAGTEGSFLAGAMTRASAATAEFRTVAALTSTPMATLNAGARGAAAAGRGILSAFGGPLGLAMVGAGSAFYFASKGADDLEKHAHDMAVELAAAQEAGTLTGDSVREAAERMRADAGTWETYAATVKGTAAVAATQLNLFEQGIVAVGGALNSGAASTLTSWFADTDVAAVGFEGAIRKARDELSGLDEQQAVTQITTSSLNDLIAEGDTTSEAFAAAVRDAASAQADSSLTQDIATGSVAAYNAITRDAVQTTLDLYSAMLGQSDGLIGVQKAFFELSTTVDDAETPWNEVTEATNNAISATVDYAGTAADAAVAAAKAAGTVLDPLTEAKIRADATTTALRDSLNDPNMTADARAQIESLIIQLDLAKEKGDIDAVLSLTGTAEAQGELDETTADRQATVTVESRNGPAVIAYLDSITTATRLAVIRVETRNGPDVAEYLRALADAQRLSLIRVETRNGPAVGVYLDGLAAERLAIIRVETRGGPAVDEYLDRLSQTRTAIIEARGSGSASAGNGAAPLRGAPSAAMTGAAQRVALGALTLDLELTGRVDRGKLARAERGRVAVEDIRAYEQQNGTGWRRS